MSFLILSIFSSKFYFQSIQPHTTIHINYPLSLSLSHTHPSIRTLTSTHTLHNQIKPNHPKTSFIPHHSSPSKPSNQNHAWGNSLILPNILGHPLHMVHPHCLLPPPPTSHWNHLHHLQPCQLQQTPPPTPRPTCPTSSSKWLSTPPPPQIPFPLAKTQILQLLPLPRPPIPLLSWASNTNPHPWKWTLPTC